ncbi:MAG: hypothetical protein EKK53_06185 [Burkholderiales bacterium]|nr:MAG: hypothetical protein EKK53_06185 [Burkholderiales bacterium]
MGTDATLRGASGRKESANRGVGNAMNAEGKAAAAQQDAQALHLCFMWWTTLLDAVTPDDAAASASARGCS